MASSFSPSLRAELIGSGDQSGTWGSTTNSNFQYVFEAAIAGYQTVAIAPTANNQVLTYTNGPTSTGSADQSVYAILKLNASAVSANFSIFAPPASKQYIIWNNTSYTATFYNSSVIGNTTAAGSGVTIPVGAKLQIWSDGTNFYPSFDTTAGNLTVSGNETVTGTLGVTGATTLSTLTLGTVLPVTSGGTGAATLAANNVILGNGTSAPLTVAPGTSGNLLTSTGTTWASTAPAPGVLTGSLLMWPTATAPSGYLLCAGAAVSRTTYAALFAIISTTFGAGDGSTTFNLPNYIDRMPIGSGSLYGVGSIGGSADAIVVSHTHTATSNVSDPGHVHSTRTNTGGAGGSAGYLPTGFNSFYGSAPNGMDAATTGITVGTTNSTEGVSATNANLPPYLGINFIIKT